MLCHRQISLVLVRFIHIFFIIIENWNRAGLDMLRMAVTQPITR